MEDRVLQFETHDRELLTGDGFASDKRGHKVKGEGVVAKSSVFGRDTVVFRDSPESKSQTVAYMKLERGPANCRNVLAVNEFYICYSVKKTMLRVIDQRNAQKDLLKGHEHPVLDIKFAATNEKVLCTVDDGGGDDGAKSQIIIWRLTPGDGEAELSHEVAMVMPLRASTVQSFSQLSSGDVWAVAHKNRFGILSAAMARPESVSEYHQLPLNSQCIGTHSIIADLAFSADGETLAVAECGAEMGQSQITLWALPPLAAMSTALGSLSSPSRILPISEGRLLSCRFLNETDLLTCTRARDGPAESYNLVLQMWYGSAAGPRATQFGVNRPVQSVAVQLPLDPVASPLLPPARSSLEHLECSLVTTGAGTFACLSCRASPYVACWTIARHDSHPSSPYPLASSLAHLSMAALRYPVSSLSASLIALKDEHHSSEDIEHLELSCYQEQSTNPGQAAVQQFHLPVAQLSPPSFATRAPAWFTGLDEPSSPLGSSASSTTTTPGGALGSAAPASEQKGRNDLFSKLLGVLGSSSAAPPASPAPVVPAAQVYAPAPPISEVAAPARAAALMEILTKPPASPATTAPAPPAPAPGLPDALLPRAQGQSILDMVKSKQSGGSLGGLMGSGLSAPKAPLGPVTTPAAPVVVPVSLLPTPFAPPVTMASLAPPSMPRTSSMGSDMASGDEDWQAATAALGTSESTAAPAQPYPTSARNGAADSSVLPSPAVQQSLDQMSKSLQSLASRATEESKARPKDYDKLCTAIDKNTAKTVEREVKRLLDSKAWRDELAAAVGQSLKEELTAAVGSKIKETVRDTVKSALSSTFTRAFENSLLPAFQAGTDRMFAQLQTSFEAGMEGLAEQDRATAETQRGMVQMILAMQGEMAAMRAAVTGLEAKLTSMPLAAGPQPPSDPLTLLAQGHIAEAVESSLEHKDTELLTQVLSRLTCSQVVEHCSTLVILCTTQQLAVDLAATVDPVEVRFSISLQMSTSRPPLLNASRFYFLSYPSLSPGPVQAPGVDQEPRAAPRLQPRRLGRHWQLGPHPDGAGLGAREHQRHAGQVHRLGRPHGPHHDAAHCRL